MLISGERVASKFREKRAATGAHKLYNPSTMWCCVAIQCLLRSAEVGQGNTLQVHVPSSRVPVPRSMG